MLKGEPVETKKMTAAVSPEKIENKIEPTAMEAKQKSTAPATKAP